MPGGGQPSGQVAQVAGPGQQQVDAEEAGGVFGRRGTVVAAEPGGQHQPADLVANADPEEVVSPSGTDLEAEDVHVEALADGQSAIGDLELDVPDAGGGGQPLERLVRT